MMKYLMVIVLLIVSGCSVESNITEASKGKVITCVDARDGEKFTFNSNTVTNARRHYGGTYRVSFDVVDNKGKKRSLNDSMEAYLKCKNKG